MKVNVRKLGGICVGIAVVMLVMGQASAPRAEEPQTKANPSAQGPASAPWPASEG